MRCHFAPTFRLLKSVVLLSFVSAAAYADDKVEFSTGFFDADASKVVDVSRFSQSGYVPAGNYNVDVFVNGKFKGRENVDYVEVEGNTTALCVTPKLAELFDLKSEAFGSRNEGNCQNPKNFIPEAKINLDQGVLALQLEIPQALTVVRPRGYVPQSLWENGVPAVYANYNLNHYEYSSQSSTSRSQFGYFNGGVNIGGWALRHSGSISRFDGKRGKYQRGVTYLQTGIGALNSQLTIGDFTTDGTIADSVSMRGVMIGTDMRMLPQTQRGYAPRVTGIAKTNATIIIRQNGNPIYQTNVPPGPFEINDLYPTGYSGELIAEIHEADGSMRTFVVPYATLVPLMRPGQVKYQLAAGRYRYGNLLLKDEKIVTGSIQYGLTNNATLNAGFIGHRLYNSETIGAAVNTPVGAFSADVTKSSAKFSENQKAAKGTSIRASYNLYVTPTKTNIMLATYRYFSKGYYSLDETITAHQLGLEEDGAAKIQEWRAYTLRPKNSYQLTLSQELPEGWGSLYFSGSIGNYWNYKGKNINYQFAYSNSYKSLSYSIGFAQYRMAGSDKTDKQVYMTFSLPLDFGSPTLPEHRSNSGFYSNSIVAGSNNNQSMSQSYSASAGEYSQFGYGVSIANRTPFDYSATAQGSYRSSAGNLDASISTSSDHSRQYSLGASGAVVIHPKGITLSNSVSNTFGIIHAENGYGAKLNNGLGKQLDFFGNAIVEHLTPYEYNHMGIDPEGLPMNLEFDATERDVVPKANTTMLLDLKANKNTMVLFNVSFNREIPMGAEAQDSKGNSVGYVAQGGMLFANRLTENKGTISLKWGANESDTCHFNYHVPDLTKANEMQNFDVKCLAGEK